MIEFDYDEILEQEIEVAEYDRKSQKPVIWGRRLKARLSERDFDHLKMQHDVVGIMEMEMTYFVVTKRLDWEALKEKHGEPVQVGIGSRGGFKWVRMKDDTYWSHSMYRKDAKIWLRYYPRFAVKCNKQGDSLQPSRRTMGKPNKRR